MREGKLLFEKLEQRMSIGAVHIHLAKYWESVMKLNEEKNSTFNLSIAYTNGLTQNYAGIKASTQAVLKILRKVAIIIQMLTKILMKHKENKIWDVVLNHDLLCRTI